MMTKRRFTRTRHAWALNQVQVPSSDPMFQVLLWQVLVSNDGPDLGISSGDTYEIEQPTDDVHTGELPEGASSNVPDSSSGDYSGGDYGGGSDSGGGSDYGGGGGGGDF